MKVKTGVKAGLLHVPTADFGERHEQHTPHLR